MRQVNQATINLIKHFEGLVLHPYKDAVGIPTIGIGTIKYPDGRKVSMSDSPITEEQAQEFLMHDMNTCIQQVTDLVKVPVNDNQFGALVSFAYNLGAGALSNSTLLRLLNSGETSQAAEEFLKWNHAGGKVVHGLTLRRQAERALFLHPVNSSEE